MAPDEPECATELLLLGAEETPGLPVIWSLSRRGVPVTAASHRRVCTGFFSRHPSRRLRYPNPVADEAGFLEWLVERVEGGRYGVTLGCGEQITYLLSKHKERLEPHTSIPLVDPDTFLLCRDKSLTMKAAVECGVPVPATWYPEDEGIEAVAEAATYPALVKPCISNGARGITRVETRDQLVEAYRRTKPEYGSCIVQEFIPHGGMQYKAELLLDRSHEVRVCGAYAKLRFYPPGGGSSTLNRTVHREDLIEYSTRILTHLGWWGMGDCDFILDPRDGVAKLMEINPRFTRTIRILVEAGLDFPYELYRLALGLEPRLMKSYPDDVYLRYLPGDLAWFLRSRSRFRARPSFFRFLARRLHYEEWSLKDPMTGVGFWLYLLLDMVDPAARRMRLR